MKITLNVLLAVVLFCSAALAGDQGNGGYQCPPEGCTPPPCTENCGFAPMGGDEFVDNGPAVSTVDVAVDVVKGSLEMLF